MFLLYKYPAHRLQTTLPRSPCHFVIHLLRNQISKAKSKALILKFKAFQSRTPGLQSHLVSCDQSANFLIIPQGSLPRFCCQVQQWKELGLCFGYFLRVRGQVTLFLCSQLLPEKTLYGTFENSSVCTQSASHTVGYAVRLPLVQ